MPQPSLSSIFSLTNPEIYVITAAANGQVSGQVATWVTLGSLIPEHPRVVTILSPRNFTVPLIQQSQQFVVNLLAADQPQWLPLFGLQSMSSVDKFAHIAYQITHSGIPILPDTCGWAECQVVQEIDLGDRLVVIAEVIQHQVDPNRPALRRAEALAQLPAEIKASLGEKRLQDIAADRLLLHPLDPMD